MEKETISKVIEFYKLDYEKGFETAIRLEETKLTYQRYYISLVTAIGTISVYFLTSEILKNQEYFTVERLIGLLLVFSTILGYILVRNLVSIRRQAVWFNNVIILIRRKIIENLELTDEFRQLKEVPENHKHSADYITINLCSLLNLIMLVCGFSLLFDISSINPIAISFILLLVVLLYIIIHWFTIEKILTTNL